jgi:hypothetical protein
MTVENFAYWLQGLMELASPTELTPDQIKMIRDHMLITPIKEGSGLVYSVDMMLSLDFLSPRQKVCMINLLLGTYLEKVTPSPRIDFAHQPTAVTC